MIFHARDRIVGQEFSPLKLTDTIGTAKVYLKRFISKSASPYLQNLLKKQRHFYQ